MEMRINTVCLSGRLRSDPVPLEHTVHFQLEATYDGEVFHCFCDNKTAENVLQFLRRGDEVTVDGKLENFQFAGSSSPTMLVRANYTSFGRKRQSLQPGDPRGGVY